MNNNKNTWPSNQELIETAQRVRTAMAGITEEENIAIANLLSTTWVTVLWWPDTRSNTEATYQKIQEEVQEWLY